jgi:hypothetical protein
MTKSKKLITVTKDSIEIEGLESMPIIEIVRANLKGQAVKKCAKKSAAALFKCMDKILPKAKEGDTKRAMNFQLLEIAELEPDNKEAVGTMSALDITSRADINVSEVVSGVAYVTKIETYIPNRGVYEFFNAAGKSLGLVYQNGLPRNCR